MPGLEATSSRSLWSYRCSACFNFEPQLRIAVKLFHATITLIKGYWRLADCIWLQPSHLNGFNSTRKWTAQLRKENVVEVLWLKFLSSGKALYPLELSPCSNLDVFWHTFISVACGKNSRTNTHKDWRSIESFTCFRNEILHRCKM